MASRGSSSASKPPASPNSKIERGVDKCQVFYNSLSDKLEALEQAVQPKWLTLEWVSVAVDFMRSTFSDMMILFEDVRALMPDVKVSHDYWIEEYMVESMKLLDVCNVLKPAVSRFEHFIMCAQIVVPAMQRCEEDRTLISALRSCETELQELVHPPLLAAEHASTSGGGASSRWRSTDALLRHASIAIGEKFTDEDVNGSCSGGPTTTTIRRNGSARSGRGTVALALVMRATRETTDFVASVLIWALKRDPASHPASTAWQQNLEVFRGDDGSLWSPSFRRLQERLRKELFEILRTNTDDNQRCFVFEELKLVQDRTVVVKAEVEHGTPSLERIDALVQDFSNLLDSIQVRLQKVATHVNQLFDELVQARKKLLDAAQRPGSIHRAHTF